MLDRQDMNSFRGTYQLKHGLLAFCLCCLIILYPNVVYSGHIVGMANHFYSHQCTLRKFGKELSSRGHRYTQLIPSFLAEAFQDIDVRVINTSLTSQEVDEVMIKTTNAGDFRSFTGMYKILQLVEQGRLQAEQLCQDLLDSEAIMSELEGNVDVFLCDISSTCCFILADMFDAIRVDFSPLGFAGAALAYYFGLPQSPAYLTQDTVTDSTDPSKFSFTSRLKSFLQCGLLPGLMAGMIPQELWSKHAKATSKNTHAVEAWKPNNLVLIGHDFALEYPRPTGPHVKVIGAVLPEPARNLPDDLHDFMRKNKNVVLVSFGSALSEYNMELLQAFADGLARLSTTVLWKLSENVSLNVAQNIKVVPWFPQNDILGHTSTKVFVTHCGLNSVLESVYHGVPMVAVPLMGDQHRQATVVKVRGLGVCLDKNTMEAEDLTQAVHEVLNNKIYLENTRGISAIMRDRRRTPTEEGADWIEYALRHDGAKHLISEALDLPEYQLCCFDVFLFLLLVISAIIFMLVKLCGFFCRKETLSNQDKFKKA